MTKGAQNQEDGTVSFQHKHQDSCDENHKVGTKTLTD